MGPRNLKHQQALPTNASTRATRTRQTGAHQSDSAGIARLLHLCFALYLGLRVDARAGRFSLAGFLPVTDWQELKNFGLISPWERPSLRPPRQGYNMSPNI